MPFASVRLTCTELGSVPGQNCADLEVAACWLSWDWKHYPMKWFPVNRGGQRRAEIRRLAHNYSVLDVYIFIFSDSCTNTNIIIFFLLNDYYKIH